MFTNEENTSKKFINFRLITFILLSVVTGILVSYFMLTEKPFYAIFMGILFFVSLVLYLIVNLDKKRLKTKLIFILVFVISFSLGGVLFNGQVNDYSRANLNFKTQDVTATVDYVEETTTGVKLHLSKVAVKGVGKLDYGIELRVYGYQEYKLGDRINFIAKLSDKEIIYDGRFASNNIANEIKYSAFVDSSDVVVI